MNEATQTTRNRYMSPPVQILRCPGGGGHLWATLNPRWYSESRKILHEDRPHWCPDHEDERKALWKERIGRATSARRQKYDDMGLPATRLCMNPAPTDHARGAVLPLTEFYIRQGKPRVDGSRAIRLDSQCKKCRRAQEEERRAHWTPAQRKRHSKQTVKRRQKKQRALANQTDRRLDAKPFADWLRQYVADTGIAYDAIEERCGLGSSTISSILTRNGRTYIAESVVEKIAVGLDRPYLLSQIYPGKR